MPNLYCRGGDVAKDNGFGSYLPEGVAEPFGPEHFRLKHTVPGKILFFIIKKYIFKESLSFNLT